MLRISPDLELPLDAVTEPMGMLAARRAGKSNAAVVLAEEMFQAGLHWVAIDPKGDWWGIRSSGDGKGKGLPVPILGGSHGDIPLEAGAGAMVADLIVDQRLTCLLDISGFASEADKIRFLLAFGDRLFRRKEQGQEPTHVFLEEADDYVPQRAFPEQQRLVHVMARILKQGGSRGLGGTVISQRSAVVHKDILSQVQTLFALRTTGPQDRKAIRDWVSFSGENPEIVASLHELADGEAWVWSPNWLRVTKRIQFRRRSTFDSGATPEVGQTRRPPATLADVDLGVLSERMAATIEKAKADDPKELRKRILQLERENNNRTTSVVVPEVVEKIVEVPVLNGQVPELRKAIEELREATRPLLTIGEHIYNTVGGITAAIDRVQAAPRSAALPSRRQPASSAERPIGAPQAVAVSPVSPPRPQAGRQDGGASGETGEVRLKAGARRMLSALAQLHPTPLTRSQMATLADVSPTSGTFSDYMSAIRTAGLIVEGAGALSLSEAGQAVMAAELGAGAPSSDELLEMWGRKLKAGARRMLGVLHDAYPDGLTRAELGERAEIAITSGTFSDYMSMLRRNGLLDESQPGLVRAGEALFLGGRR